MDIIGKILEFINPWQRIGYYATVVQVQVAGIKGVRKMQESPIEIEGIEAPYGGFWIGSDHYQLGFDWNQIVEAGGLFFKA